MSPEIQTTYPQEPVIVDGIYSATLKDAVTYAAKDFDGNDIQKLAWTFDVEAPEDALDDDVETEIEGWTYSGTSRSRFTRPLPPAQNQRCVPCSKRFSGRCRRN